MDWLEPKLEIEKDGRTELAYLIAYDHEGNKFTNCSSILVKHTARGDVSAERAWDHSWHKLKEFAQENLDLLTLVDSFDQHPNIELKSELPANHQFNQTWQLHNNFGICESVIIRTGKLGLSSVSPSL